MSNFRNGFLSLLFVGASAIALQAQILWTSPGTSISGDSDVKVNGTFFDALQLQSSHTVTELVNGEVFNILNHSTNSDGFISISTLNDGTDSYPSPLADPNYQAILTHTAYVSSGNTGTITIGSAAHPLKLGDEYQVEIWLGASGGRATRYSGVTPLVLTGAQYGLGTFTATATTLSFTFTSNISSFGEIDAISVRDVPEPSTWAMMLGGVLLLGLMRFRRGLVL